MCISRKTFTIGILVTVFIACMIFRADNVSAITGDKDYLTLLSYNGYGTEIKLSGIKDVNTVTCECSNDDVADVSTNGWTVFVRPKNAGEATITVRQNDDEPFICSLNVVAPEVSFRHDEIVFDADMKKLIKDYPYYLYEKEYYCPVGYEDSPIKTKLIINGKTYKKGKYVLYDYSDYQRKKEYVIRIPQLKNGTKVKWVLYYKDKKLYKTFKDGRDYPEINIKAKYKKNKAQIAVSHYLKGDKLIVKVGKKKYTWKIKKDCRKPFDPKKKTSPYRGKVKYKFKVPGYNKNTKMTIYMKDKYNKVFYKRNVVGDWIK